MPTLEETIKGLSPGALRIFKQQLPQRLKQLGELERNTALSQLRQMPELADVWEQPTAQVPTTPLQKGLQVFGAPFQWISKNITEPFGAVVTAPFTPELAGGRQANESALAYARRQYEQWQEPEFTMPWGGKFRPTKGVVESLPWFATAFATGGLAGLGAIGARTGITGLTRAAALGAKVIKPIVAVEKALAYPITKPLELAAKKILPKVIEATKLIPTLQPIGEAISIATNPTKLRNMVNASIGGRQPLKAMAETIAGRASTADNPATLALVGRDTLRFEGANKATVAIATLNRLGNSKSIFNLSDEGLMTIGKEQVHLNTIRTYPKRYNLNEAQRTWVEQASLLEKEKRELFAKYDVKIRELTFEEGGEYAGRRVVAKLDAEGNMLDVAYIGARQPAKPGIKLAAEKTRVFENIDDAIKEGYRYLPEEEALYYNITGAYNRVADKEFANWFMEQVPWRTVAVTGETAEAKVLMLEAQGALKQIQSIAMRWKNNETISGQMLRGIKKHYPKEYQMISQAQKGKIIPKKVTPVTPGVTITLRPVVAGSPEVIGNISKEGKVVGWFAGRTTKDEFRIAALNIESKGTVNKQFISDFLSSVEEEARTRGLKSIVAVDPSNVAVYKSLGFVELEKGVFQKTISELPKAEPIISEVVDKKALADTLLTFVRQEQLANKKQWADIKLAFKEARASAVRPGFTGTMAPDIPAFAGKVFTSPEAKEYINIIRKEINPSFNSALSAINQVNAVGRYFALAGDVSPFGIQLLFLAGAHPKIYGKAMGGFVRAFFDPLYQDNFLANHLATIQKHTGLITTKGGATEITEAMARGGLLRKQPFKLVGKALTPFQRGFESAIDTAGVYMAEAYDHLATSPARIAQIDAFINEFRGLMNTTRLGISSTQRQLERAVILAPQYNRAIGSLMLDLTQGNLRGELARKAMAKGTAAIMAMTVAVSYALGESEEEIVEHLNPLSNNFMTWDIAGQRIGPGSKVRSLLATFGKMVKNPEDTGYYAGRFLQGNFSPFLGTSMDLITGKNYLGDPTRDGLPNLTKTLIAENLLPIWVQSVAFEGGDLSSRVTRGLAEFGGMRGYPAGAYAELREAQDKLAQGKYGMSWDELGMRPDGMALQMQITRESPELQALSDKAETESAKYARGEQLVWNEYGRQVDRIGNVVTQELNQAASQFEATGNGNKLRDRVNQAYWLKSQMMRDLLNQSEFSVIKDTFDRELTEQERTQMQPQKLLYRDYNEMMYAQDMFDVFGEYRFDEADRRRDLFIQQYGLDALNSVEMVIGERRADEPDAVKMLRQARVILKPYWDIETQIWDQNPPEYRRIYEQWRILNDKDPRAAKRLLYGYPQVAYAARKIALEKKRMKLRNKQIAQALNLFY